MQAGLELPTGWKPQVSGPVTLSPLGRYILDVHSGPKPKTQVIFTPADLDGDGGRIPDLTV